MVSLTNQNRSFRSSLQTNDHPDIAHALLVADARDNLGSVRQLAAYDSGMTATTIENYLEYDSFGNITRQETPAVDHVFGHTGRERDEETGMHFYRARYFDPVVGRFISEDPIGFEAEDSNLVRYVNNETLNSTDPKGLKGIFEPWYESQQKWPQAYLNAKTLKEQLTKYLTGFGDISAVPAWVFDNNYSRAFLVHYIGEKNGRPTGRKWTLGVDDIRSKDKLDAEKLVMRAVTYRVARDYGTLANTIVDVQNQQFNPQTGAVNVHPFAFTQGDFANAIHGVSVSAWVNFTKYEILTAGFHHTLTAVVEVQVKDEYDFAAVAANIPLPYFAFITGAPRDEIDDHQMLDLEKYGFARRFDVELNFRAEIHAVLNKWTGIDKATGEPLSWRVRLM